jgi:hypothetical protein
MISTTLFVDDLGRRDGARNNDDAEKVKKEIDVDRHCVRFLQD